MNEIATASFKGMLQTKKKCLAFRNCNECPALPILLLYDSSHERNLHGLGPQGQTNQIILPEQS